MVGTRVQFDDEIGEAIQAVMRDRGSNCSQSRLALPMGQIVRCFYYFFMVVVVIRYKTKATARRALAFIVRIFVNDTIAIAVWTSFHVCVHRKSNALLANS